MKYTNGFFQLNIHEDGVYARIFPAKEGGKKIDVQEFVNYLELCGIKEYNQRELYAIIKDATEETEIFVSSEKIPEVNEIAKISVTDDRMMAFIRFYPPSKNGKYMSEKDILNELNREKIKYGVSTKVIQAYMMGRQFCRNIPIAKGKEVIQGKEAKILYQFETAPIAKPKLLEDGSVDFHQLNMFIRVKKGDLLAELIPEQQGTAGVDVYGNMIKPAILGKKVLKYGRNIQISEDKTKIYSEVDGDVKLEGDTVFVNNTYVVPADVDTSTGDIQYNGNVFITGNVRAGFVVEASGDIEVNGVVEGAILKAGGNIVLKRGVQGMSKGRLEAGNDIVTKFLESCTVKAGNIINTGSSLHSDLTAGNEVLVSGKKGFMIGGTISAGKKIEASVYGNKMNTVTTLKVGVEPEVMERYKDLSITIKEKQEEIQKHSQTLDLFKKKIADGQKLIQNQLVMAKQAGDAYKTLSMELESITKEYTKIKEEIENDTDGRIIVHHTIYPGVSIYISNRIYQVKNICNRCQFKLHDADVVNVPI